MRTILKNLNIILVCLFVAGCSDVQQLNMYLSQKKVAKNIFDKNISGAQDISIQSLAVQPDSAEALMNLGLTFELQKKNTEALSTYTTVEKNAKNEQFKFFAHFNKGQLLGQTSQIDEALDQYQAALKYNPNSLEVKTNIELLIKKQQQQQSSESKDKKDGEGKEPKDQEKDKDKDKDKDQNDKEQKKDPKQVQPSAKYKPRPFNGEQLNEEQVKKILGELKRQEQKIRDQYQNQEVKELPRAKDW